MKQIIIIFTLLATMIFFGCENSDSCYSQKLELNSSPGCTNDCPGVCGCDGQSYCNECTANGKGIEVVSYEPCN